MNINSEVIILLCSNIAINQNVNPFNPSEWSRFAEKLMKSGLTPSSLISMSVAEYNRLLNLTYKECERIEKLLARKKLLFSELKKYADMGIYVITRADAEYPKMLKSKLKQNSPPLFYCFGDVNILKRECAGFVGSRNINDNDIKFIEKTVNKINYSGYAVVSGGARGTDSTAEIQSIRNNNFVVEYVPDSLINRAEVKGKFFNNIIMLSAVEPDAEFTTVSAMTRNRYIYAHSIGTVVVKSDYKKGGTWHGAFDCIKRGISPVFCRSLNISGNAGLIRFGAIPIDENWDGDIKKFIVSESQKDIQLSFFD